MGEDTTIKRINTAKTVDEIAKLLEGGRRIVAAATFFDPSGLIKGPLIQGNREIKGQMLEWLARAEPFARYFVDEKDGTYRMHPTDQPGKIAFAPARTTQRVLTPSQQKMELANILGTFQEYGAENLNKILDYFADPNALAELHGGIKDNLDKITVPEYPRASQLLKASVDWEKSIDVALLADGLWQVYSGCQHRGELTLGTLFHRIGAYLNEVETPEENKKARAAVRNEKPTIGDLSHRIIYTMRLPTAAITAKLMTNEVLDEDWRPKDPVAKLATIALETYNWLEEQRTKGKVNFNLSTPQLIAKVLVREAYPPKGKDCLGGVPSRTTQWLNILSGSPNYIKSG